ncbi:unnamed protein product [Bemisia tabaci]|uniref:Uncharacterized protein n=1 Tax=Bemisia tabaci TaxID=7038 RepID=A0A9P0EVF9_BEMTA|nr:unnamed protein product [Bemisia tabaci]
MKSRLMLDHPSKPTRNESATAISWVISSDSFVYSSSRNYIVNGNLGSRLTKRASKEYDEDKHGRVRLILGTGKNDRNAVSEMAEKRRED